MVRTVTLDTSIGPEEVIHAVPYGEFAFAIVSVTDREVTGTRFEVSLSLKSLSRVTESGVWGESKWGRFRWARRDGCLERALVIIGDGSFPKLGQRDELTDGQRHQLRDAMIFCAHVRESREIFVSDDLKAFVNQGRREKLQTAFDATIMTREEFLAAFGRSSH